LKLTNKNEKKIIFSSFFILKVSKTPFSYLSYLSYKTKSVRVAESVSVHVLDVICLSLAAVQCFKWTRPRRRQCVTSSVISQRQPSSVSPCRSLWITRRRSGHVQRLSGHHARQSHTRNTRGRL